MRTVAVKDWAYGWHWRPATGALTRGDGRVPKRGELLVARGKNKRPIKQPRWCKAGFHAAHALIDSCDYSSYGQLLSFVMIGDARLFGRTKFVGRTRMILWEGVVPSSIWTDLPHSFRRLEEWLRSEGFKADSARAYGRRMRKRRLSR